MKNTFDDDSLPFVTHIIFHIVYSICFLEKEISDLDSDSYQTIGGHKRYLYEVSGMMQKHVKSLMS